MAKTKMTKDVVPRNFTMGLALVDALPVAFFGGSMLLAGLLLQSGLFLLGAALCLFAGLAKVLWKIIVVKKQKNIWWLFLQMRILMPVGLVLMIAGAVLERSRNGSAIWQAATSFPAAACFLAGLLGMGLMIFFAFRLDSSDVKANWIEQLTNAAAQAAIFLGLLLTAVQIGI